MLQFSSAASRLIVQETVADRLQLKLQRRLENLRVGNSLDKSCELGAMTCSWMPKVVAGFVDEARHEGAQVSFTRLLTTVIISGMIQLNLACLNELCYQLLITSNMIIHI